MDIKESRKIINDQIKNLEDIESLLVSRKFLKEAREVRKIIDLGIEFLSIIALNIVTTPTIMIITNLYLDLALLELKEQLMNIEIKDILSKL